MTTNIKCILNIIFIRIFVPVSNTNMCISKYTSLGQCKINSHENSRRITPVTVPQHLAIHVQFITKSRGNNVLAMRVQQKTITLY